MLMYYSNQHLRSQRFQTWGPFLSPFRFRQNRNQSSNPHKNQNFRWFVQSFSPLSRENLGRSWRFPLNHIMLWGREGLWWQCLAFAPSFFTLVGFMLVLGVGASHLVCGVATEGSCLCCIVQQVCAWGGRGFRASYFFLLLTPQPSNTALSHLNAFAHIVPSVGKETKSSFSAKYLNIFPDSSFISLLPYR